MLAALFVLTPNALSYEGLLVVPLILISGVFGIPSSVSAWAVPLSYLIPTAPAVATILGDTALGNAARASLPHGFASLDGGYWLSIAVSLVVSCAWFAAARVVLRAAVNRARSSGTLELI